MNHSGHRPFFRLLGVVLLFSTLPLASCEKHAHRQDAAENQRRSSSSQQDIGDFEIPATDSAAAATAMSTGEKTEAGNVCWEAGDPPDGALQNLAERCDSLGWAVGVVS